MDLCKRTEHDNSYKAGIENDLDDHNVWGFLYVKTATVRTAKSLHRTLAKINPFLASKYTRNIDSILTATQIVSVPKTSVTTCIQVKTALTETEIPCSTGSRHARAKWTEEGKKNTK